MAAKTKRKVAPHLASVAETIWLPRAEAVRRTGLSLSGLRSRVRDGAIHEARDSLGKPRYDAAEIDAYARRRPPKRAPLITSADGEVTARAFERFIKKGVDVAGLIVELRLRAPDALELADAFAKIKDLVILSGASVRDARRLLLDEHGDDPMTGELLVQLVTARTQRFAAEREALLAANKAAVEESEKTRDEALAREQATTAKLADAERERNDAVGRYEALATLLKAADVAAKAAAASATPAEHVPAATTTTAP